MAVAAEQPAQAAAQAALARQLGLARRGRSMLHSFIGRSRRFEAWRHYPLRDAIDASGRWQFYFHAHDRAERDALRHPREHGHIHLFRRSPQGRLTHLAGLALDARGVPLCWFATNQWVTGGCWRDAPALVPALARLELRLRGPLAGVARWLADLARFYAEPLAGMLRRRDAALARHCARHGLSRAQARADRRVAVWSALAVHWPHDALRAVPGPARSFTSVSHHNPRR